MNKEEAKEQFLAGKIHPHCPECKTGPIRLMDRRIIGDVYWQYYLCMKGHPFKGAIE